MSEISLPEEWCIAQLGELLDGIQTGKSVKCEERPPTGTEKGLVKISAVTWGEFNQQESKTLLDASHLLPAHKIQLGDLLISRANTLELVGASVTVKKITKDLYLSDKVLRLELGSNIKQLVAYFLKTLQARKQIESLATGNQLSMRNISQDAICSIKLPFCPLAEQQQIAQKLDELLAQVDTLKTRLDAIPNILKRFRQSVLAAAVSGRLTEEWRGNCDALLQSPLINIQKYKSEWVKENKTHNEAARVKKRVEGFNLDKDAHKLNAIGWVKAKLEDCVLMVVDCHNKTAPYVEFGIPLIRTPNIRDGKFVWSDLKYVDEPTYEFWSKRCKPETGDLVFTREAPMGEVAIIPENKRICLGQRTMLFRPVEKFCSAKYITLCLMDPVFRENSEKNSVGTGVKHYRVGDVSNLEIALPPVEEQTEIVRRVEQLFAYADQIEQRVKDAQARVNHLTQSILAKAFRGELTADWRAQNPELISGENSAAALLERIKAEREVAVKPKRKLKAGVAVKQ